MVAIWTTTRITEVSAGKRTIGGTDWPVSNSVDAVYYEGKLRYYLAVYGLCNGVPSGSEQFKTKKEAIAAISLDNR